jgi:hypothetical protein
MERFEKVNLFRSKNDNGVRGALVADGDSLRFESKKGTLLMPKVRGLSYAGGRLHVEYGEAGSYGEAHFVDASQGLFKAKGATQELEAKIRNVLSLTPMTAEDQAGLEAARGVRKQASGKQGRTQMVIGGVLVLVGLIITAVTYSGASSSSSGGTYIVAYGPVIFGLILFFQGLVASRASRR